MAKANITGNYLLLNENGPTGSLVEISIRDIDACFSKNAPVKIAP